jgi:hypothetical protein
MEIHLFQVPIQISWKNVFELHYDYFIYLFLITRLSLFASHVRLVFIIA